MKHTILTIITPIDPAKKGELEKLLDTIRTNLLTNLLIPFQNISLLHFASFVIYEPINGPDLLIFENNFDGKISPYLDELVAVAGEGLHQIYQCCTEYSSSTFQPLNMKMFLKARITAPNAYHIGNVGRKAKVIKDNRELRAHLQLFLDKTFKINSTVTITEDALRANMQTYVRNSLPPDLYSALPGRQTFLEKFLPYFNQFIIAGGGIALLIWQPWLIPIVLIAGVIIILILRYKEELDNKEKVHLPTVSEIKVLIDLENRITQNHLANITDIKPGLFRLVLLKVVLFGSNLIARTSTKGKLSGIPSIHFAHWSIINNNKQLLFLSNYDGSWSSYLDDFIDKAAKGLTGIWSNTQGFPPTRFLVLDGARDEILFKNYARNHQVRSLVWYSAYRDLTVQNIDKDSKIREQLLGKLSTEETREWLKLF
jgi:hypothetical protein